jgi:hypothetical protein
MNHKSGGVRTANDGGTTGDKSHTRVAKVVEGDAPVTDMDQDYGYIVPLPAPSPTQWRSPSGGVLMLASQRLVYATSYTFQDPLSCKIMLARLVSHQAE